MTLQDFTLPYGIQKPLHILPPWVGWALFWACVVLLVVMFLLLLPHIKKLLKKYMPEENQASSSFKPTRTVSPFAQSIESIRKKSHETFRYRDGLFEVMAVLKEQIGRRQGQKMSHLTSYEFALMFEGKGPSQCIVDLEKKLYDDDEIDKKSFDSFCDRAKKAGKSRAKIRRQL